MTATLTLDQAQDLLRLVAGPGQPGWARIWRVDSTLNDHLEAPALPSLRAWRLLQDVVTTEQLRSLRSCGMAVEERGGRRYVLDLQWGAVHPVIDGHVELLCISAHDLCRVDQLITKLLWLRADPTGYLTEGRLVQREDRETFAYRLDEGAEFSKLIVAHYDALQLLAELEGDEAVADLQNGTLLRRRHGRTIVLGRDPILVWSEGWRTYASPTGPPGEPWSTRWLRITICSHDPTFVDQFKLVEEDHRRGDLTLTTPDY